MAKSTTRPYTLFQTDAFDLDSAILERRYEISVALPLSYHATQRRYPVLVVLDANLLFATAVEAARLLAMGGEAEPCSRACRRSASTFAAARREQ